MWTLRDKWCQIKEYLPIDIFLSSYHLSARKCGAVVMRDSFGSFLVVKGLIKIIQCLEFFFRAQRERNFLPLNPKSWGSIVKNARICKGFSSSLERFSVSPVLHLCSDYCQRVKLRCFPRHLLHTLTKTHAVTRTHLHKTSPTCIRLLLVACVGKIFQL